MKIRLLVDMSGTRNGQPWPARGAIADLPTAEAAHYVSSGIAEKVADDVPDEDVREVETATPPPAEISDPDTTPKTRPRGRPRKTPAKDE